METCAEDHIEIAFESVDRRGRLVQCPLCAMKQEVAIARDEALDEATAAERKRCVKIIEAKVKEYGEVEFDYKRTEIAAAIRRGDE